MSHLFIMIKTGVTNGSICSYIKTTIWDPSLYVVFSNGYENRHTFVLIIHLILSDFLVLVYYVVNTDLTCNVENVLNLYDLVRPLNNYM